MKTNIKKAIVLIVMIVLIGYGISEFNRVLQVSKVKEDILNQKLNSALKQANTLSEIEVYKEEIEKLGEQKDIIKGKFEILDQKRQEVINENETILLKIRCIKEQIDRNVDNKDNSLEFCDNKDNLELFRLKNKNPTDISENKVIKNDISEVGTTEKKKALCENLYFLPDAEKLLKINGCDVQEVSKSIDKTIGVKKN